VPRFLQPLIALFNGRAPRALKLEASVGLLQASLPYPRGGLRWYRVFLMPRPVTTHLSDLGWGPALPRGPGGRRQCFLALMVSAPESTAPTPPRGALSMFLSIDGVHSRIYSSGTSQGARRRRFLALMVGALGSTAPAPPRGGRCRRFLALMVGAPGSPAPAPLRGPVVDVS
jgi:hypothetical protein